MTFKTEELGLYPAVRRWLANGFRHNPTKDAPQYEMVCLETDRQRVFIEPQTGYWRMGRSVVAP